jgi:hypothetical protein
MGDESKLEGFCPDFFEVKVFLGFLGGFFGSRDK